VPIKVLLREYGPWFSPEDVAALTAAFEAALRNVGCAPFGMNAAMSKPLVLQFLGRSDLGVFRACRKYKHVGFVFAMYEITRKFAVMVVSFIASHPCIRSRSARTHKRRSPV